MHCHILLVICGAIAFPLAISCDSPSGNSNEREAADAIPESVDGLSDSSPLRVVINGEDVIDGAVTTFEPPFRDTQTKRIEVRTASTPITITSVGWLENEDGETASNPHVVLDLAGLAGVIPFTLPAKEVWLPFAIRLEPPQGLLEDFSVATLVVRAEAVGPDGLRKKLEHKVTFVIGGSAAPAVSPASYTFLNATVGRPETQPFSVFPEEGSLRPFHVIHVALETTSTEFELTEVPTISMKIMPGRPETNVSFSLTYTPVDDLPDTNAIIVKTDVPDAPILRIPISSGALTAAYTLVYSDPNAFDFRNVTTPTTRSVTLTSKGPGSMAVRVPSISPAAFSLTVYSLANGGGSDAEVTSWPRGLSPERGLRFDVTFTPTPGAGNGTLVIPIVTPELSSIELALLATGN